MIEVFVPGRLCLFGEHSDWAAAYRVTHPGIDAGACLVAGTDQGMRARAERHEEALEITSVLPSGEVIGPARIAAEPGALAAAASGADFFSYAAGALAEMQARFGVGGLRLRIETDLPLRKGLSSSAAICVLVSRAAAQLYGVALDAAGEMDVAYAGERSTGSECGRMDQVCAFGQTVTALAFDGDDLAVEEVAVGGPLHLLVVDLRAGKDTRRILSDLNACFPDTPGAVAARVRDALGAPNLERLARARGAVEAGDAPELGALMTEAQEVFDRDVAPACPELRSPRLHELLDHPAVAELAHGGKGVGSQGDGCAQLVAKGAEERDRLAALLEASLGVDCLPLTPGVGGDGRAARSR